MTLAVNLGFPRFGYNRELKKLVEGYWSGKLDNNQLLNGATTLKSHHWYIQRSAGIANGHIPSNDFSLYDHVLDHSFMLGVIPEIYRDQLENPIDQYFAMGRGHQNLEKGIDIPAQEMKKWFNTNYHYIVPELSHQTTFKKTSLTGQRVKPVQEYLEAKAIGIQTKPVLIGPISFLLLSKISKSAPAGFSVLALLPDLLKIYVDIVQELKQEGCSWIQFDEPFLVMERPKEVLDSVEAVYKTLSSQGCNIFLATYFETIPQCNLECLRNTGIKALHVDLVLGNLEPVWSWIAPTDIILSLGVVNGRNIWKTDFDKQYALLKQAADVIGKDRIFVAPSCSLIHSPHSLKYERKMDPQVKNWMSFACEKLDEIVILSVAINDGIGAVQGAWNDNRRMVASRATSELVHDPCVQEEMDQITGAFMKRASPFVVRAEAQKNALGLPLFPTTTIGSFPQTKQVRIARQKYKKKEWTADQYNEFIKTEIKNTVKAQEEIGLDILVHGESERTDMVEYFGEYLKGFVISENGWVQSYGSRCVKPPIIYGDVSRPFSITVDTSIYAQSITEKKVKGMLTGPVTILQWSFVRDDQPRKDTAFQIALALRKEVLDLEAAGISVIQIDEPAIREGLPIRKTDQLKWLNWAVEAFKISSCGVSDMTQIHTHMCYSDFNDIFDAIKELDADCITIENSKSDLKLLKAFEEKGYTNFIGPGVYDVHSARVPSIDEMKHRLKSATKWLKPEQLWINPDCGLKTRGWEETEKSLHQMVDVAKSLREEFAGR